MFLKTQRQTNGFLHFSPKPCVFVAKSWGQTGSNTMVGNTNLENGITQIYYSAYVFEIFTPPNGMHVISYQNPKTYEYI